MSVHAKSSVLVIAPHPDDETLGCGGTLLKHAAQGDELNWLIVTGMSEANGYEPRVVQRRQDEIIRAESAYGFKQSIALNLPPAGLDTVPMSDLIVPISSAIQSIRPTIVYVAYRNDAHTDHQAVFDAAMAATKSFRYPFIKEVLVYETISETDFGMKPEDGGFRPNVFVDIADFLSQKLKIMEIYGSEMGEFPFPRSQEAVVALARIRGVQCNAAAAEAFMLVKGIR